MRNLVFASTALAILYFLSGCAGIFHSAEPVWYEYEIVNTYPHDSEAFTQGLIFLDGFLFESTGRYGRSSLRKTELETGEVIRQHDVDEEYFAEGLTEWDNQLIQITLNEEIAFVYNRHTFEIGSTFRYSGTGWGLTNDGEHLIMSDGSPVLRYFDPETFRETGRLEVTEHGEPVKNLNELQMIEDTIFANILFRDYIVMIDAETGHVKGRIDLQDLLTPEERKQVNVLNGIAWDAEDERLFVTGKLWHKLFEIRIRPPREDG